jgi:type II secretory pathway pseudopilin PulG
MQVGPAASRTAVAGFSLVEVAIVLVIVGLLLLSLMSTLASQVEQRNFDDTRRRLDQARELVLASAIVNGRLPCPARSNSVGAEVRNAAGECKNTTGTILEDHYGGTLSDGTVGGLLPAVTIGFQPVDSAGFAVDGWGNRLRYAVAKTITGTGCGGTLPHFVHAANLKTNGMTCLPSDLIICNVTQTIAATFACSAGTAVTNKEMVAAIVFSTGKNGNLGPQGSNETENVNGQGTVNRVFVSKTPDPASIATGEFDDMLVWIPVGLLYGKLISAGVLP